MGEGSDAEIVIRMPLRRAAILALTITAYVAIVYYNGMKNPITGKKISKDFLIEVVETVEQLNVAVGNESSTEYLQMIEKIKE